MLSRTFLAGLGIFAPASALAAPAPRHRGADRSPRAAGRRRGRGRAAVADSARRGLPRGAALGVWSGVSGLGVPMGPLVGGAVVDGLAWQWILWLNVPVGLALLPLARRAPAESHGPAPHLDLVGLALGSLGLLGIVFGIVRGDPATSVVSLIMYFGIFGAIFFLAQVFQTAQGYLALESGLGTLPWT